MLPSTSSSRLHLPQCMPVWFGPHTAQPGCDAHAVRGVHSPRVVDVWGDAHPAQHLRRGEEGQESQAILHSTCESGMEAQGEQIIHQSVGSQNIRPAACMHAKPGMHRFQIPSQSRMLSSHLRHSGQHFKVSGYVIDDRHINVLSMRLHRTPMTGAEAGDG